MIAHEDLIDEYASSLIEPDEYRRLGMLERVWADDCEVILPGLHIHGRDEVNAHISRIQREYYGTASPTLVGSVDAYEDVLRYEWRIIGPLGDVLAEGVNFADRAPDGRLQRVVVFFGFRPPGDCDDATPR